MVPNYMRPDRICYMYFPVFQSKKKNIKLKKKNYNDRFKKRGRNDKCILVNTGILKQKTD